MIFAQSSIEGTGIGAGEALIKSLPVTGPIIVVLITAVGLLFRAYAAAKNEQIADLKANAAAILEIATRGQTTIAAQAVAAERVADNLEALTAQTNATRAEFGSVREKIAGLESTVANKIRSGMYTAIRGDDDRGRR